MRGHTVRSIPAYSCRKLYEDFSEQTVKHDIEIMHTEIPERFKYVSKNQYVLDDEIDFRIRDDGCLIIEDRRGIAFCWLFEIQVDEVPLITSDIFVHEGKAYSVANLHERSFEGAREQIIEKINQIENSIAMLKANTTLNAWNYTYYDAHENIKCKDLGGVITTVLNRKPF